MPDARRYRRRATARDFRYFADPALWPTYPFLPVTRRADGSADLECGVLYDAYGVSGTTGYRCTVFLANLFDLPPTPDRLLAGPRCVYDTFDELADAGWAID
jgi:hypothetical protein